MSEMGDPSSPPMPSTHDILFPGTPMASQSVRLTKDDKEESIPENVRKVASLLFTAAD